VLHLGEALSARGHGVRFTTVPEAGADVAVAVNDARLLPAGPTRLVVWFHNEVTLWRELRRGRVPALWRRRPEAVFCGAGQARQASRVLPFRRRIVLPHGLPDAILRGVTAERPPASEVVYISQAYRGLAELIALWRSRVSPADPKARLRAYIAAEDIGQYRALAAGVSSIAILPRISNAEMPRLLARARVLVAPGHPSETFCLAAAEAIAMGVPVVTFGHGALAERVAPGRTGFICRDPAEMASCIGTLLGDDALWCRMHEAGLAMRAGAGWDHVAGFWEESFIDGDSK
jgi:glycosyltransferase involved in cell wall biosynthesis